MVDLMKIDLSGFKEMDDKAKAKPRIEELTKEIEELKIVLEDVKVLEQEKGTLKFKIESCQKLISKKHFAESAVSLWNLPDRVEEKINELRISICELRGE